MNIQMFRISGKKIIRSGNTGHQGHCIRLYKFVYNQPWEEQTQPPLVHEDSDVYGTTKGIVQCTIPTRQTIL